MPSRKELANAIRVLSMDAVQKATSGHPGAPMGMADIAEVLWREFMNHNPINPHWINRDRFILSNGHASMLIYSLLHLTGYDLSINELQNFRQFRSKTPGHPEYNRTPGIETTTGPLGQGFANAIGFAIAERTLAAQFNRPDYDIVNHNTYVFLGDGCMMEGISHEASSIAGTLKLGKLFAFYDDNGISIDGDVKGWFTDDTAKRFESYGWHVIRDINGHDSNAIRKAINEAKSTHDMPSLLICKTVIGFGSPHKAGTHNSHGAPLGDEEIILTRRQLEWKYAPFEIPDHIYSSWDAKKCGEKKENDWKKKFSAYAKMYPKLAVEFKRRIYNKLPVNWYITSQKLIQQLHANPKKIATRQASQNILEEFGKTLSEYLGGSADLAPSNLTMWSGSKPINEDPAGNYIHYGVREFGMTAIANGIALHGGFLPYTATFLMFSEYARNAVRMAAMMNLHHIIIYTHDSIGLGEDGPTHQPIEQIASLRTIPNINLWRPCDQVESAVAWKYAVERLDGPSILIFSRQNLSQQNRNIEQLENIVRGGYILKDSKEQAELILIATGSEVQLAIDAYIELSNEGYKVRVVSMPSTDVFDKQTKEYIESVLPKAVEARLAIEAGIADYWFKYTGLKGAVIGMNTFGESAPNEKLFEEFGFTVSNIVAKAKSIL
ncbi:transketolase [Candidatus Pantoea carbekii]|uniref:Transketolase n=1 Tax=Candidatus Pantoea carbekii TaxID=1235990 RepID=U3U775_9GAMM|nr:transketolase [Candidatus Pantoea carbekii]AKC32382.1 transketolase 1 TktA [Candidatus Pantoea carbekii]BAO00104.1 TktA protein [Candidatus Pantoea carbekii]